MIDLHCHVLPGCDDGAKDLDEALSMCRTAAADGIETLVACAHYDSTYKISREELLARTGELSAVLEAEGVPLSLLTASDAHACAELPKLVEDGIVSTVADGGRYLLLELPSYALPENLGDLVFRLAAKGVRCVITHPERNAALQADPEPLVQLVGQGALVQVTAMSLTGDFGPAPRRATEDLIRRKLAHVIATDAHSPNRRPPVLSKAVGAAARLVGEEDARAMVEKTPKLILAGEDVEAPEPLPPGRRGLLSRFVRRP